jgi:hypothetical protein
MQRSFLASIPLFLLGSGRLDTLLHRAEAQVRVTKLRPIPGVNAVIILTRISVSSESPVAASCFRKEQSMRNTTKSLFTVVFLSASLAACGVRAQMASKTNVLRENDEATVDEKGDAKYNGRIVFSTEAMYSTIKQNFPNPSVILRDILGSGGKAVLNDSVVSYDDTKRALDFKTGMIGAASNQHNKWKIEVGKGAEMLDVVSAKVGLPAQAEKIKMDPESGILSYEMPHEPVKGDVSLDVDMKVKPRLMPALAKIYGISDFKNGTYWTAKTLFTNSGTGDITHLQISYKIGDYSSWSPPSEYTLVKPGGHVVDLYYPLLSNSVADLKSRTPVDLEVKYTYTDAAGKEYNDTTSKRITILGANGFEYSNATEEERTGTWADLFSNSPLIAAFVTKMDDPVRAFGGMVAQVSGGQPGGISDEGTVKFCKALYETEVANHLSYQGSTELTTENGGVAQELKYPRDVLRDKSGTCIELAILYAATCETAGVRCQLMMIPGHCFPVVTLPSGGLMPVEATAISGAAIPLDPKSPPHPQPYSFQESYQFAQQEFNSSVSKPGMFYLVDVQEMWEEGVLVPELPKIPADVLTTWGWKQADAAPPVVVVNPGPSPRPPQPQPVVAGDAKHPTSLVGTWKGTMKIRNATATRTMILNADGSWTTSTKYQGRITPASGSWEVSGDGSKMVIGNSSTGFGGGIPFSLDDDTDLSMTDPILGVVHFQKAN